MNKHGHTTNFKAGDYLREIKRFVGKDVFDYIIVNNSKLPEELIQLYETEGDPVENDLIPDPRVIAADVLSNETVPLQKTDTLKRSLIRHDSRKLAEELMKIVDSF